MDDKRHFSRISHESVQAFFESSQYQVARVALPTYLQPQKPLEVTTFCRENQIILAPLLPNATHLLQPLDVAVFKPLKNMWYQTATRWRLQHGGRTLSKQEFIVLFQGAFEGFQREWLVNGFRKSGNFPWNPDAIDFQRLCRVPVEIPDENTPGPSNDQNSSLPFIIELEERLNFEQLELFRGNVDEWRGPESMKALYDVWKLADHEARGASATPRQELNLSDETLEASDTLLQTDNATHEAREATRTPHRADNSNDESPESILSLPTPYRPRLRRRCRGSRS